MQLLERITSSEAAASFVLATGNACYFGRYAAETTSGPRRVAASALLLVNLALAAEALLYLAFLPDVASGAESLAVAAVRGALLAAVASISALVLRQRAAPGRRRK